ncbi:DUF4265 domain-containing protein [Pseudomaricurvus alkylphenolicus]|uniref:DUF4265 domain-containing protein n=1 Tax=Pseudomaricurvus alkylphenolicus TaxID=1306991 RepID=UPI0014204AD9|nr:DUF4265 domain-containing protein [Pseudomaricurvus alkylphenolicus]NIB41717.1 DUF4265 domain-containing protein [Pseudomaricurvus alkylphenolicus]
MNNHINLRVEGSEGGTQPVEVESISSNVYRILYSPGFVEDVAAGDIIRVTDEETGAFEVIEYGGNVSVKISDTSLIIEKLSKIDQILSKVNARRDGNLEHVAVWTIPAESGFEAIETSIAKACELLEEPVWWYGNVYDSQNNPINWWR